MAFIDKKYYHFHIYVVSKETHYDDTGGLVTCLKGHPAVVSLGLYKAGDDVLSIISNHKYINTVFIDPYTLGFKDTEKLISDLRNEDNDYRQICIVLLNRNREGETLNAFLELHATDPAHYIDRNHYKKLVYDYNVSAQEATARLDALIVDCQENWFRNLYKHEVVISYCSDDRAKVEPIVRLLKEKMNGVFYDVDEQADLVGNNLEKKLPEVYNNESRYCVMFVSKEYNKRVWPMLESKTALARNEKTPDYIIPISIDGTKVPGDENDTGSKNNIVYYNGDEKAENIVSMILRKIWVPNPKPFDFFTELRRKDI